MKKEVFLIAISASIALGANKQTDLNIMNANNLNGITGAGVNVGVIDGAARQDHSNLSGQINDQIYSKDGTKYYKPDFSIDTHGTHVTSIIVGKKDNSQSYGLAYNAKSYNVQITGHNKLTNGPFVYPKITNYFISKNIKAINNSWNSTIYPLINMKDFYYQALWLTHQTPNSWILQAKQDSITTELMDISNKNQSVVVFASGNEGMSSPGLFGTLRSYDESLKTWITVGSVDASVINRDSNGNLTLKGSAVSLFSNSFKGTEIYSIMAAGQDVWGANATYMQSTGGIGKVSKELYAKVSGTSQATPYVTAAATLVAEKFSFLTPSQIADVILSTANNTFKRPKVVAKKSKTASNKKIFTVFYLDDNQIPMKDGKPDVLQIRTDLRNEGYDYFTDSWDATDSPSINAHIDAEYPWVQKATFEEIFGQGILDVGKAMGGLGKLDANRMSKNDIQDRNGEDQAIYTVNTQGENAEFSNDISQVEWKDEWHLENAKNSQKNLKGISKIGLEKTGDGILILSGANTYKGDTIVSKGSLKLTGSITSDAEVKSVANFILGDSAKLSSIATIGGSVINKGTFIGAGSITGDFTNEGLLKAGFYDEAKDKTITSNNKLDIQGKFTQKLQNAEVQLAFTKNAANSNSILKAGSYDATGGKLNLMPLHSIDSLIKVGDNIKLDIDNELLNSNIEIYVTPRNLVAFNFDKNTKIINVVDPNSQTNPTPPVNPSTPTVNPGSDSTGSGSSTPSNPSTGGGSGGENQSGQGQGSQTPTQPQQPTQPQTPSDNTGNNQNNNNTGNQGNTGVGNQNNNQNQNNQAEQIAAQQVAGQQAVAAALLAPPVSPANPDAAVKALQGLLANAATLSPNSTAALAQLDNLSSGAFGDALNAMKNTPTNTNIDSIDTMQKDLTIKNALFLIDPASSLGSLNTSSSVFAPTAAFGDEYLGKVDDVFIKTELSAGIAYRHTDHDDYKQNSYLLDLQAKKALNDSTLLGGFIGLSNSKTEDELSDTRSNMFSLGLSLNHNFDNFGVLLGASAGMSFNRYEQSIKYLSNAKSDANYKNYFANFQGGVYKSFKLNENLNLTPIALLDYSVIRQDSFSQSGALAKNYEAKTTHFSRGWLGANLVYNTELNNNWRFNTSLFAFYWKKFNHKDINQNLSFVEASDQKFLANTSRSEKQGFYGGIALGASKGNKFFRISLSDEKARAYNQYEIMLRAGLSF
nr:S8 family serine peptidase [uncultured Campylobacter sp.]